MECILILTQIRLALVFFVIHKDIGSLFGVLGWKYILSKKNRHKAQRKAKFYINKCRSASCMQGGLKQASA